MHGCNSNRLCVTGTACRAVPAEQRKDPRTVYSTRFWVSLQWSTHSVHHHYCSCRAAALAVATATVARLHQQPDMCRRPSLWRRVGIQGVCTAHFVGFPRSDAHWQCAPLTTALPSGVGNQVLWSCWTLALCMLQHGCGVQVGLAVWSVVLKDWKSCGCCVTS
jgi:hypothetical protein